MFSRQKIGMLVAEFLGTAVLTLAVLAVSASNIGIGYFVSFAAGLAMIVLTLAFAGISGAIFNPAITVALWTVRKLRTLQALLFVAVQLAGGLAAYALFTYMTDRQFQDRDLKYDARLLVAEVVGATILALGFASAVFQDYVRTTRAIVVGAAYTLGVIVASAASAAFINPAVALGARSWEWTVYALGPVLGAIIGVNLYNLLFRTDRSANVGVASANKSVSPNTASRSLRTTAAKTAIKDDKKSNIAKAAKRKR